MPFIGQLEPEMLVDRFVRHPPWGFAAERLDGGIPAFSARFDILTTAPHGVQQRVRRSRPSALLARWLHPYTRFIGCTATEYAWFPMGADPRRLARTLRESQLPGHALLVVKDIPVDSPLLCDEQSAWAGAFAKACAAEGFVLVEGQALAWMPIDFSSTDEYLSRLSRPRRRDLRRKLRVRTRLDVSAQATGPAFSDPGLFDAIYALYRNVYEQSETRFDLLTRDFMAGIFGDTGNGGVVFLYRHAGRLIGWNLCFEFEDRLIDKYIGLSYPESREHNLYAISWVNNLEYALARGLRCYVAGWTDPAVKAHLGARFTFTRHAVYPANPLQRFLLRHLTPVFERDSRWRREASP